MVRLFAITLLTGAAESFCGKGSPGTRVSEAASIAAILATECADASGLIGETTALMKEVAGILHTTLPTLTSAAAFSGSTEAAVGAQAVYLMAADLSSELIRTLLLPALFAFLILAALRSSTENELLNGAPEALKNLITFSLRLILTLFLGYTGILKIFGTVKESVAKRSLKLAITSAVPLIGSLAGEAADSIFAVAGAASRAVGVAGLIGILSSALLPLVHLGVRVLLFRLFSFLIMPTGGDGTASYISSLADFYGMLFAVASSGVILALLAVLSGFIFISI